MRRLAFLTVLGLFVSGSTAQTEEILSELGLADGDVFAADIKHNDGVIRAGVVIDGYRRQLVLARHSVRADSFNVLEIGEDDRRTLRKPPEARTYRGSLVGLDGAAAFAVSADELRGVIMLTTGEHREAYAIEPIGDGLHVSYSVADIPPSPFRCSGVDYGPRTEPAANHAQRHGDGPGIAFDCIRTIVAAFDADYEFYQLNGSDVDATVRDIESVMNVVNLLYEDQMMLSHEMGETLVRTSKNDPYTSTVPSIRLREFRLEWNENQGGIERDVAHLFTGVDLDGDAIGRAFGDVICEVFDSSYAMSESLYSGFLPERAGLTAHELGHNWGASHCDNDPDCGIMCSDIGACPCYVEKFGQRSVDSIVGWAEDHEDCLGEGPDCNDCPADLDGDGDADADDFFAYLDAFADGNQDICDVDQDGDCDAEDFFGYLDLFAEGC